jgi:hypothetical protein
MEGLPFDRRSVGEGIEYSSETPRCEPIPGEANMRVLRPLLLFLTLLLLSTTGCSSRSAFQQKPPPDPLVSSSSKKPVPGTPTSGDPGWRTPTYPAPPPVPDMTARRPSE